VIISYARLPGLGTVLPLAFAFVLLTTVAAPAAINPGDTLSVKVWNHPELSQKVTVDADGGIRVPLSGVVAVGGLDEAQAGEKLALALKPYVVYPAVSVETLEQGKNLFVSGGPGGVLKYQPGETLNAAIADAMQTGPGASAQALNAEGQSVTRSDASQSLRARIDLRKVKVQRNGKIVGEYDTVALSGDGETGPQLQPGDTIVFANKPVDVRVVGDVAQPGTTYLSTEQSLSEAIAQAGGALPTSASNHILLQRDGTTRSVALGDPAFSQPAKPGDVITIPAAPRVNVVGPVVTPGLHPLKTDSSLLSALYAAGGPTKYADLKGVKIVHEGTTKSYNVTALTHGDMSQNPTLADGDTVVVPQGHYFDWSGVWSILGGVMAGLIGRL
jgi:protein involved in polysaccharide export with SLBB domain